MKLGFVRSQADPCLFIQRNEQQEIIMLALCHVDDTQIAGTEAELDRFKQELCERFNIKDLGKMKKHLGVTYNWNHNVTGPRVTITMKDLICEIISMMEEHIKSPVPLRKSPASDRMTLDSGTGEEIDAKKYRSIVGKAMFVVTKILIEAANAV